MILRSSFRKRWHRLHGKVSTLLSWNRWTSWGCGTSTKPSDNIILSKFVMASASDEQLFYWVWKNSAEPFQQKLDKSVAIAMVTLAHCLLQQIKPSKAQSCPCCELLQRYIGGNIEVFFWARISTCISKTADHKKWLSNARKRTVAWDEIWTRPVQTTLTALTQSV